MEPGFHAGFTLSASREAPVLEDNTARVEKCARSQTSVLALQTALPEEIALLSYLYDGALLWASLLRGGMAVA